MMNSINDAKKSSFDCKNFTSSLLNNTVDSCLSAVNSENYQRSNVSSQAIDVNYRSTGVCEDSLGKNGNLNKQTKNRKLDTEIVKGKAKNVLDDISHTKCNVAKSNTAQADFDFDFDSDVAITKLVLNHKTSFLPIDAFRNLHCAIGSALSTNSSIDKLLRNEPVAGLQNQLPLSLNNATVSVTTHVSPVFSDTNWLSSRERNIGAFMSSTFSMADIAIIVPTHLEKNSCNNCLKVMGENIQTIDCVQKRHVSPTRENAVKSSCFLDNCYSGLCDSSLHLSKTPKKDRKNTDLHFFPSCDNSNSFCDSLIKCHLDVQNENTDSPSKNNNELSLNIDSKTNLKIPSEKNCSNSNSRQKLCDWTDLKDSFSNVNDCSNTDYSLPNDITREMIKLPASEACVPIYDTSEWQYVENARSKQKRRHCQALKTVATAVSQTRQNREKKPLTQPVFSTKLHLTSSRPMSSRPQSKSNTLTTASIAICKREVSSVANVSRLKVCDKGLNNTLSSLDSSVQVLKVHHYFVLLNYRFSKVVN